MSILADARFGGRAAVFAAYTTGTLGLFEVIIRTKYAPPEEELIAQTMRRYGRHMTKLFGVEIDAEGVGEKGYVEGKCDRGLGRVFVSNHRSGLDILVTIKLIEGKHVSRADLAGWPVLGPIAKRAGILFVNREDRRSAAAVVRDMIACIERGVGVIIFPEGTTFAGDEVRPFMPGALAVARRTGCEVVPIGIAYAGEGASFEEESFMMHMRRIAGTPKTRVAITVGEPFRAETTDTALLSREARDKVQELVNRSRRRLR